MAEIMFELDYTGRLGNLDTAIERQTSSSTRGHVECVQDELDLVRGMLKRLIKELHSNDKLSNEEVARIVGIRQWTVL